MSPTLLRTRNLRFVIYPHDHEPAHIHVYGPNAKAKFEIETLKCIYCSGFSIKALKEIRDFLSDKTFVLMEAWYEWQE